MAGPLRVADCGGDARVDLPGRPGHQPRRGYGGAGLAEYVRLQFVFLPDIEMGRWNLL